MSTPTIEQPRVEETQAEKTYTHADLYFALEAIRPIVGWVTATASFAVCAAIAIGMTGYAIGSGDQPNVLRIVAGIASLLLAGIALRNLQRARRNVGAER